MFHPTPGEHQLPSPEIPARYVPKLSSVEWRSDVSTAALKLAKWVLRKADRHCKNNRVTVTELQTYLPEHPFADWIARPSMLLKYICTDRLSRCASLCSP